MIDNKLIKEAGIKTELLGDMLWGTGTSVPGLVGAGVAGLTPTKDEEEMKDQSEKTWSNLVPGVASYRKMKRLGRSAKDEGGYGNVTSESIGPTTSTALASLLGAGIGGGVGMASNNMEYGAILGGLLGGGGSLLANLVGAPLAAMLSKRKTREDMEEDGKNTITKQVLNYAVPGSAVYNRLKRYGYTMGEYDNPKSEGERELAKLRREVDEKKKRDSTAAEARRIEAEIQKLRAQLAAG
jgi:5-formyltetrahydrofolate cyclo-ligase